MRQDQVLRVHSDLPVYPNICMPYYKKSVLLCYKLHALLYDL